MRERLGSWQWFGVPAQLHRSYSGEVSQLIFPPDPRFSNHPSIALPDLQPYEYGNVFFEVAKDLLGSMLAVPLRDNVIALLLLSHLGFANGMSDI